jgi:hypothetical protein
MKDVAAQGTVPEMISAVRLEASYTTPILSVFLANGASRGKRSAKLVTIPSETRIDFTLRTPVTLTP